MRSSPRFPFPQSYEDPGEMDAEEILVPPVNNSLGLIVAPLRELGSYDPTLLPREIINPQMIIGPGSQRLDLKIPGPINIRVF